MRTQVIFIFVLFSTLFIIHDVTHSEVLHPTRLRVVPQEFVNSRLDRTAAGDAYETSPTPHTQIAEKSPLPNEPLDPPEQGRVYLLAEGIQYPSVGAQNCGPLCYHNTRKVVGWSYEHCVAGWETGIENDKEVMGTDWDVFFGLWSNPQQLSESASDAGRLDMVRDINGTVHCVWHQNHNLGGSSYEVYYSKYQFGSFEWSEPVLLSTVDTIEGNFPTVHVDNAGHVTARWSELLRDSVGNIISYYGYRTIRSDDWGETWDSHTMQWATQDPFRLWGAGCSDHVTGDIYLVDAEPYSDYGDAYADLVVYYYDRSFDSWFGPDIAAFGGSTGEFYHDISHVSATVGPDGICYILFAQTTNPDPGYLYIDSQVYAPVGAQLFIISGSYGNWSVPVAVYPGTDGFIYGFEDIYPDSTFMQFCSYAQIGSDAENNLYISTRAYEYYNGWWISGNDDMHHGYQYQPEAWIAKLNADRDNGWVWTRASDINLRPDDIGVKYTKLTEHTMSTGPAIVWDETYDGSLPSRVLYTRLNDFQAPGEVLNLHADRPIANGPVTITWDNPDDDDLAGILIVRSIVGKATLVGLRNGSVPMNEAGQFLYSVGDLWIVTPDSISGQWDLVFVDMNPPEGDLYYTLVPFDGDFHHAYPLGDGSFIHVFALQLTGTIAGGTLELNWPPCPDVADYWIHGVAEDPFFEPGIENRVSIVPSGTTTWSTTNGIGDPDQNWTYIVVAVDDFGDELAKSNRFGEHEFGADIP